LATWPLAASGIQWPDAMATVVPWPSVSGHSDGGQHGGGRVATRSDGGWPRRWPRGHPLRTAAGHTIGVADRGLRRLAPCFDVNPVCTDPATSCVRCSQNVLRAISPALLTWKPRVCTTDDRYASYSLQSAADNSGDPIMNTHPAYTAARKSLHRCSKSQRGPKRQPCRSSAHCDRALPGWRLGLLRRPRGPANRLEVKTSAGFMPLQVTWHAM